MLIPGRDSVTKGGSDISRKDRRRGTRADDGAVGGGRRETQDSLASQPQEGLAFGGRGQPAQVLLF